jgi:hypothetical protein
MSEREFLTKDQAIELVGGKREYIHCFLQSLSNYHAALLGADWTWDEFEKALDEESVIEVAGSNAAAMNHPLAILKNQTWYFFAKVKNENQ